MDKTTTLFQYLLTDHTKSRDRRKSWIFVTPKNHSVVLTATSNYDNYSVDKYDDEEDDLSICNLNTTDDEENDETKDPFETAKASPSELEQIDTALSSHIFAVPIVVTKAPVFQLPKYLLAYHKIMDHRL